MAVRAKFRCNVISAPHNNTRWNDDGTSEQVESVDIQLYPVVGGSEENKKFYTNTPGGSILLNVVNPEAAKQFEIGKEYYVDFTEAK